MAVPSPVGDVKIVSSIGTFVPSTLTLKLSYFFLQSCQLEAKETWIKILHLGPAYLTHSVRCEVFVFLIIA